MKKNAIDRIKISGFRRLADVDLEMRPFMVIIGANGVGKSTFLDAISLLSASASGEMNNKIIQLGGANNILTRSRAEKTSFLVDIPVTNRNKLNYELVVAPHSSGGHVITEEILSQVIEGSDVPIRHIESLHGEICYYDETSKKSIIPNWNHSMVETSLAQAPINLQVPGELRRILSTVNRYHTLEVGVRAPVRLPQAMRPADLPGTNGEDLIPYLYYLRESNPDIFETLVDTIKPVFPDFESLAFPPVAAGMLSMVWNESKFEKPIYIHELSEGILRYLWLLSILYSPHLSAITMIDEPEVSMHPELLSLLVDVMRETSMSTQLIVATHSDRLVRFLRPEEVVVMDIDDEGCATATWADTLDLDHWLSDFSLDEIWQMGVIGGRAL